MPSASAATQGTNQAMLYPGDDYRVSDRDLLSIRVMQDPEYVRTVRVGTDGNVELPYIGSVHLDGLTLRAARDLIADRLRAGAFIRDPEVLIQVQETLNGAVTVTGEVHSVIPVSGERRLIDVISAAGGLPANASHTVKIIRPGVDQPIEVNLGADLSNSKQASLPVYPRDIIQVSRAGVVYVLGAFQRQGAVPLDQALPLSLLQLVSLSGGAGFEGRYDDLRIIRTEGAERKLVQVDYKKIREGKATDPILQSNDIVFLPTDAMKAALKSLGTGGVIGLVGLLISLRNY